MTRYILLVVILAVLFIRYLTSQPHFPEGKKVRITTTISSEPRASNGFQEFSVNGIGIKIVEYPEIHLGDKVILEGVIDKGFLVKAKLVSLEPSNNFLYGARQKILDFYKSSLPEPHAALVSGIVIGNKRGIPESFWQKLKDTGTTHVVVASGMNVTFVGSFLIFLLLNFMSRKKAVILCTAGIWIYSYLSGFDAPIIRAAIMGTIAFAAQGLGRLSQVWRALLISAMLMILIKPMWITDLGFILSFGSTIGIVILQKKINERLAFMPSFLRESVSTSLAAQVLVAPILFVTFGRFNPLSPIINALVLWTIAPIMVISGISGIVSMVFQPLARLILYLVFPLTSWFVFIINLMSS